MHLAALPSGERTREIMRWLSVSERSVERWTKNAREAEREQQPEWVLDLWLDCLSEREIEVQTGIPGKAVNEWLGEIRTGALFAQPPESRWHFDVWSFADGGDSRFFGHLPPAGHGEPAEVLHR